MDEDGHTREELVNAIAHVSVLATHLASAAFLGGGAVEGDHLFEHVGGWSVFRGLATDCAMVRRKGIGSQQYSFLSKANRARIMKIAGELRRLPELL